MEDILKELKLTDERAQQALDDIDLARKFPMQGGFIEEQPSGWYPCRSAAPGSSTSSPAPTHMMSIGGASSGR